MIKKRIIARLDIKNEYVIKGIHLEGLRKVGDPNILAKKYYDEGIDEIVFMDAVAAYYDRNSLSHIIEKACEEVFVPITVGGGIRTIDDIKKALNSGADKVAINTKAIENPNFIKEASEIFGSQCIVASVVAKKISDNKWEAYIENGREPTGVDVITWVQKLEELGAGEIMLTSLDKEGTKKGFETELYKEVESVVSIPLIASGGMGNSKDAINLFTKANIDAIATASTIHYNIEDIKSIKNSIIEKDIKVRI
ncbi:MAG: imidazole glycerol phosphate synthase subunit HisF [Halarcobacter ebronensis]|uniref:imidazole glycerol phosphate synthase subunit HisF n=1 Tax=Halarcobacter ebronensis TaxID=1462615 RepID=UPI003C792ED9